MESLAPMYDGWLSEMAELGIKEASAILEDARSLTARRHQELEEAGLL